jgi:hypothetical protein
MNPPGNFESRIKENDVLGLSIAKTKWTDRAHEMGMTEVGYLPFEKAVKLTREFQPGDPTNPKKDFANDLRLAIIERLEERDFLKPGNEDNVKFYSALGMPLDIFHGIDAFVEFTDKAGITHRVTLDETTNSAKLEGEHKADIVFAPVPDVIEEETSYLREIDRLSDKAALLLLKDLS